MTVHNRAELDQEKRRVRRTTSGSLMPPGARPAAQDG